MQLERNQTIVQRMQSGILYQNIRSARTGRKDSAYTSGINPNPTVGLTDGYIWVRDGEDGDRSQTVALIVSVRNDIADIPILIGELLVDGTLCAIGPDINPKTVAQYGSGLAATGVPATPSEWQRQPVDGLYLSPGSVRPSTLNPDTLYVYIVPFMHQGQWYGGIDHDIGSANVPGTTGQVRWVAVVLDADNTPTTVTATARTFSEIESYPVNDAAYGLDSIVIPAGSIPVGACTLAYGQTDIADSRFVDWRDWLAPHGTLLSEASTTLTIATGAVTAGSGSHFIMAAESGTADDLATITTTGVPRMIIVRADSGDTITVKHGTGNISLNSGADYALSGDKTLALFWNGAELTDLGATSASSSGGSTQAAVYASLTTGSEGDLRFPTDGFHVFRSNGSALIPWGPLFPLALPSFSGSWTNQGSATITTEKGSIVLTSPGNASGAALRVYTKAAPSTPYTITVAFIPFFLTVAAATGSIGCGILFRQSSDGKLATLELEAVNSATEASIYNFLAARKWTDAATFSNTYINSVVGSLFLGGAVWMRIADNGTNRICSLSTDGQTWKTLHSVGRTDFLTADEIGFFLRADGAAANDSTMRIISYAEA